MKKKLTNSLKLTSYWKRDLETRPKGSVLLRTAPYIGLSAIDVYVLRFFLFMKNI